MGNISYYQKCCDQYDGKRSAESNFSPDANLNPVYAFTAAVVSRGDGCGVSGIFTPSIRWASQVDILSRAASDALSDDELIYQPPGLLRANDPARRLSNPIGLPGLNEVTEEVVGQLEESLYGCYVAVDKVHIFRQLPCANRIAPFSSWAWHADGHPSEYIKVAVYLNDVDESCSAFELLWSDSRDRALRTVAHPMDSTNWLDGEARNGYEFDESFLSDAKVRGYSKRSVYGSAGTAIIFSTNCVHRGTLGREGVRDTLILRLRPAMSIQSPRLKSKSGIGESRALQPSMVG